MLTTIIVSVAVLLLVLIGYLINLIIKQKRNLSRFQSIIDIESEKDKLKKNNTQLQQQLDKAKSEKSDIEKQIEFLREQVSTLNDEVEMQAYGLYKPKYDLGYSVELKEQLDTIRKKQKAMIRNKSAIVGSTNWTVDGSRTKGKTMINRQIQLMARAFNGECDSIISKVKYNNIMRIVDRMTSAYNAINKLGQPQTCRIQEAYFNLKIDELHIVHQYQEQLEFEKQEQRRIREQIRDEQRAQKELEKARQDAEKEEERYQKALDKARQEVEQATGEKQNKLQAEIEHLNKLLLEAQANKERAMSRAQMTKSGHVYVISNIGSFGENVYKVGMTRRLEPLDRVRELGDASVPFRFDIHAMIYSEDAPTLENEIHRLLERQSVNRINTRKEFFNVSLEEIEEIVRKHDANANFIRVPPAEEFRKTQLILAEEMQGKKQLNM